jgi:CBS domain-containing protein
MPVADYCTTRVETAGASETLRTLAERMDRHGVGCIVVTEEGRVRGVATDRDVAMAVLAEGRDADATPASALLGREPIVVHGDRPLRVAAGLMRRHALRRLPVVDRDGRLVGIISRDELLQLLGRELSGMAATLARQGAHGSAAVALAEFAAPMPQEL